MCVCEYHCIPDNSGVIDVIISYFEMIGIFYLFFYIFFQNFYSHNSFIQSTRKHNSNFNAILGGSVSTLQPLNGMTENDYLSATK